MTNWEYAIETVPLYEGLESVHAALATAGNDGWECFKIDKYLTDAVLYFKRPK